MITSGTVRRLCLPLSTRSMGLSSAAACSDTGTIRFLNAVERPVPAGKLVHAIVDNYATHTHPKVKAWLARHPRWTFHFTPKSGSWLNAVEGFFSKLTRQRIRRGVFRSLADLQAAINRYLRQHNDDAKTFVWTKHVDAILAKLSRLPVPSV